MPTIAAGSSATHTFVLSQGIAFACDPGETASYEVRRSGSLIAGASVRNTQTVGPFAAGDVIVMTAQRGSVDYDVVSIPLTGAAVSISSDASTLIAGGFVLSLTEQAPIQTVTATGTVFTGAGEYGGFTVRAIVGASQTVTVYDATSAVGTPIHTETVSAVGSFPWSGSRMRPLTTGCHVVISGGTSRTLDVLAG